ncbi:Sporulation protein YunB [Koleobacter methoxysyntrophicus]|uniref:Sporulation protein YunB n=1 Tax=Koleobacter methoxysyntrophicus TaxID=2751313 RepID=A0A8A0RPX6_9FIRM|nr:sporulation protein YunB [Koleobacter methoxysyntrophicus]QSQ09962.1 Sporulation protein YunB [Koleobacter methoxysyntrophicus]
MIRYSLKKQTKLLFLSLIITVMILLFILFYLIEKNLGPTLLAIAEARARIIATETINDAINKKIARNVQYKDLISVHKSIKGEVALIQINITEINRLKSETALYVADSLKEITMNEIGIPIGQITGSNILANFGPSIKFSILPVGTVEVDISEAFEEAGINQTRHKVFIDVKTWVRIAVPLVSSSIQVSTHIPIAETIIVGNVPETILNLNVNK